MNLQLKCNHNAETEKDNGNSGMFENLKFHLHWNFSFYEVSSPNLQQTGLPTGEKSIQIYEPIRVIFIHTTMISYLFLTKVDINVYKQNVIIIINSCHHQHRCLYSSNTKQIITLISLFVLLILLFHEGYKLCIYFLLASLRDLLLVYKVEVLNKAHTDAFTCVSLVCALRLKDL